MSNFSQVVVFYALALGASLAIALFAAPVIGEWSTLIVMLTPLAAVLIMKLIVTREGYRQGGWSELGLGSLGVRTWGLAFGLPFIVLLVSYGIVWMTGIAGFAVPPDLADMLLQIALNFGAGLVLCFGEEIGWRGYLLPRLMRLGTRPALLLSGFMQALWHLPFILFTAFYHGEGNVWLIVALFVSTMTVAGVLFGYLRLASGSTWPAIIAHSIFNSYWTLFGAFTVAASPLAFEYLAGESGLLTLVGVTVSAVVLLNRLERKPIGRVKLA